MDRDPKFPFVSVFFATALWFSGQKEKADTLLKEQPRSAMRAFVLAKQNPATAINFSINSDLRQGRLVGCHE